MSVAEPPVPAGRITSQVDQQMSTSMGAGMIDAMQLVSSAMLSYPNCA
jgi:hypothetical protein